MANKTAPPSIRETVFDCPHCDVCTTHRWFYLRADSISGEKKTPDIPDESFKAGINGKIESGLIFFQEKEEELRNSYRLHNVYVSRCSACDQTALWVHDNLVFPSRETGTHPNPKSAVQKTGNRDVEDARHALTLLRRSTAALLGSGVQRLRVLLGEGRLALKKLYTNRKLLKMGATKPLYKQWWVWVIALTILPPVYWMLAPDKKPPAYKKISPAEHLTYAQQALELKNFSAAKHHLDAIPKESPLFVAVEILRKEVNEKQQQEEMVKQAAEQKETAQVLLQARQAFAKTYEKELLQQGMDAAVTTQGEDHDVLHVRYLSMDKRFVNKLSNNTEFMDTLRRMEFKQVRLTNGYDESWNVNP